ncbi:MAG: protein translocase subunit SecD [Bdellovibrionales bacterium]|nr:protein translocase subunit SecD [Bdellovibrionales bacterium]
MESIKARVGIFILSILIGLAWVMPNFINFGEEDWWFSKKKIVYGLDIQGGLHLVMGVDTKGVIVEKTNRLAKSLQGELTEKKVGFEGVKPQEEDRTRLDVMLKSEADVASLEKYIEEFYPATLQILDTDGTKVTLRYYDNVIREYKKQVIDQAIEVIRNRIDEFGVAEPSISAQGDDRILVQLPGIKDAQRAKELINRTARLDFRIVNTEVDPEKLSQMISDAETAGSYALGKDNLGYSAYVKRLNEDLKGKLPENTVVVFQKPESAANLEAGKIPYVVQRDTDLGGNELEDANVRPGEYGEPEVIFSFNPDGRRKFSELTEKNVQKQMAIVLDEVVQSAPVIQGKISTSTARITLGGRNYQETMNEASFIATALRAGALPAALEQLEERTVGPTLGADAINAGKKAGMVGAILVLLFMVIYYRGLGVVANIALCLNVLFLLAILTSLGATLTLPGVAGIALTIGMAVDANIIIFERIKEELRKGAGVQAAIKDGFGNALSAIMDANITTIATSVVLMYYGTGPVRGFAVSLIIGVLTSMFTAIFVCKLIMDIMVNWLKVKKVTAV